MLKIYKLDQDLNDGYDTYDSCIVVAENEAEARRMHPDGLNTFVKDGKWFYKNNRNGSTQELESFYSSWIQADEIDKIKEIGRASCRERV